MTEPRAPSDPLIPHLGASLVRVVAPGLAAAIANITIGGGIFRLPAAVAVALGPAAPMAYVVCAIAMGSSSSASRKPQPVSLTGGPMPT